MAPKNVDPLELLRRHQPLLKFDSQECYFADSAAEWTDNPGNLLRFEGGATTTAAAGGELSLGFLGATYGDGQTADPADLISDPGGDYRKQAFELHQDQRYRNQIYGRVTPDERWLQYWCFYFYNDYNLIGNLIGAGRHEGDWEMIQIHLDGSGSPDRAVYAQHDHAAARRWDQVDLLPGSERPIVYVARGSHASYYEPGLEWTGHWFDHADGKRKSPEQELLVVDEGDPSWHWISWPGSWGDTKKGSLPVDSSSPTGPGAHRQWDHPESLEGQAPAAAAPARPAPAPPAPPRIEATHADGAIRIAYELGDVGAGSKPKGLAVTVNSPDERTPPTTYQIPIDAARGTVDVPHPADPSKHYDVYASVASADGLASASVRADLPPE